MREEAILVGKDQSLVGVVTYPSESAQKPGLPAVILLNAGLIHRIGPNRTYVKLARQLAESGFPVLRFDLSGIGDSLPRRDNLPFEKSAVDDSRQAMDFLTQKIGVQSFVMMGHCAGAFNSFATASADKRVTGMVLINPEGANDEWSDFDRKRKVSNYYESHYSPANLASRDRWVKFLTGKASYGSILRNLVVNIAWNRISTAAFRVQKKFTKNKTDDQAILTALTGLQEMAGRGMVTLFIYSEGSTGFLRAQRVFTHELRDLSQSGHVKLEVIPNADHVFTLSTMQHNLVQVINDWMGQMLGERQGAPLETTP
ncbi:MAG: alpha/beta fold hydrolase [Anaerolineaceae bacterium]|nr:alpha/beta fold hydrolase [Anaerolineaceae bacterium]